MGIRLWTDRDLQDAVHILERTVRTRYRDAVAEISAHVGREVSTAALHGAFIEHGLRSPSTYCPTRDPSFAAPDVHAEPIPPPPPLDEIPVHVELEESPPPTLRSQREPVLPKPAPVIHRPEPELHHERELHRLREENRRYEAAKKKLLDELAKRDVQLAALTALAAAPAPPIVAPRGRGEGKQRLATPVMLLSDWHVEEPVKPELVNGLNEYNLEIAERCIDRCAEAFEWLTREPRFDMREAVVALIGDLFSGYIHEELQEANFLSPVQACVWLLDRIERMLRRILAETAFERIIVPCNDGNHGRLTRKIRAGTRTANSLEWLLYKSLAARFAGEPRVQFQIADGEYNYLDVFDHTLCFFHGDSVQYQGGVGGLFVPMRRGLNEMRKYRKVDSFCFGHFHQRIDLPEMSGNGSMIGITPWGMSKKFSPEPRQQSFFLVDSSRGKCLSAPIWL
jgi:hypothetical protein